MASVWDFDYTKKHGVAESTLMLATSSGGHFYNGVSDVDIDNGSVVVVDVENYVEQDVFEVKVPKITDKVCLVLTAPKIYEEYTKKMQEEAYFYNAAGERMRIYEVYDTDRFTLSAEAFSDDADPALNKYVVVDGTGYKLTTLDREPEAGTYGFVGKIYAIANNGNYRVFVKRNRAIEG